jgi:glycosyltransferase involved in cell wall biosynthesis
LKPLRVLMLCMQYPVGPGQSYMTTELADALVASGHKVDVLHLDWQGPAGGATKEFTTGTGVRVVRVAPREIGSLGGVIHAASKFVLSGRHVTRVVKDHFDLGQFDVAIAWMPAIAIAPLVPLLRRAGIQHRLLFIWDFFPDHHREIGRIPSGLPFRVARAWEQRLLAQFTAILCTLPGNADYLRRRYRVSIEQRVLVTPIWSVTTPRPPVDRAEIRQRLGLPTGRPIAVFGGQIVEGRGFEQMLGAADAASSTGSTLLFLFVGEGRLTPTVRSRVRDGGNVMLLPPLPREAYLELLGACDVGMVATVPGVTSFSIPTKTIDYLRAGLPVIAAVEQGSDFVAILDRYGVGRSVPFGEAVRFATEADRLATDPEVHENVRAGAARCLDEVFDVRHTVAKLLEAAWS